MNLQELQQLHDWATNNAWLTCPKNDVATVILSEKKWLYYRDCGYVDFTDEELKSAPSRNNLIKRGCVPGVRNGIADMYIDPRYPDLEV